MDPVDEVFAEGVAVVTGAGSGIGAALAHRLGRAGMRVAAADVDAAAAERTAASVVQAGGDAFPFAVDVGDAAAMAAFAAQVHERLGPVRLLVNNAGVEQVGYLWDVPADGWRRVMDTNLGGVFNGVAAFVPAMIDAGGRSRVLCTASVGAVTTLPLQAPYIASKHAVLALAECLHQEVAQVGADIAVSAVLPGPVRSAIFASAGGVREGDAAAAEQHRADMQDMLDAALSPEEAAEAILAQAAAGAFFITTHPEAVHAAMDARAARLRERRPPEPHRSRFAASPGEARGQEMTQRSG